MPRILYQLFILFCSHFFISCVSPSQLEEKRSERERQRKVESDHRLQEYQRSLQNITDQYTPKDPTPQDLSLTKERSNIYCRGLIKSIRELDDGISPADAIAKAAVSENIDELRSWKRAQTAHLARPSTWTKQRVEQLILSLPRQANLDEATSVVLRHRKGTL